MPVPANVKQLLEKQNIAYGFNRAPEDLQSRDDYLRKIGAAKAIILQDEQGFLQVIIGADQLLDLSAVNRLLSRDLRATKPADLANFYKKHQLDSTPALPKLGGMTTLIEQSLLERTQLLLDSGTDKGLLELSQEDFKRLLDDSLNGQCGIPLAELERDNDPDHDESQLLSAVTNFTTLRVKQRLEETLELPPLSDTAQRIINLRVDPNADISDLASIVETDPSLAAQVVSWAASPYYSAPGKIKSIHDAIVRVLGFDMVLNLSLGLALGKSMSMPKDGAQGATPYWQQAVYVAAAVEGLVTAIPREKRPSFGMSYLSGLLHNFGYLVLAEVFPPHFSRICRYTEANPHVSCQAIERHILGITREQLASWLMSLWHLPEEVVVALRQQGNINSHGENSEYAKLVLVAKRLLRQQGIGDGPKSAVPLELYDELNLDPEKAFTTIENIMASSDDLDAIASQLNPDG